MMGQKDRRFDPLPSDVSLENLVPKDNFYRRLEATLDLSFVGMRLNEGFLNTLPEIMRSSHTPRISSPDA